MVNEKRGTQIRAEAAKSTTTTAALLTGMSWLLVACSFLLLGIAKVGGIGYDFFHLQDAAVGLVFPALGLLLVRRRGSHPIGWILIVAGLSGGLGVFGEEYVTYGYDFRPGSLPAVEAAAWIGSWIWIFFFALLPVLLFLFPDGRLVSKAWRLPFWSALVPVVLAPFVVAVVTWQEPLESLTNDEAPLFVNPAWEVLFGLSIVLIAVAFVSSMAALGWRWHRARGIERQQMKVFSVLATAGVACLALSQVDTAISEALGVVAFLLPPVGLVAAILRYRLYDIDRLVSRTVSYGVVTTALAAVFFGLVFVLRPLLHAEGELAVAASTLAVAALFNPFRRRVQQAVDRHFNRARYDARHTVETFTRRLRTQLDVADLGDQLTAVVASTVQPSRLSLWLRAEQKR